jgi:hypothetical protein
MNYDPDTQGFCGTCILKLRGWKIDAVSATAEMTAANWAIQARTKWQADVAREANNFNFRIRLAWFLYRNEPGDDGAKTAVAVAAVTQHLQHAEANLPFPAGSPGHITFLRSMALYHKRATKNTGERDRYIGLIQAHTTEALDISGLR